MVVIPALLMVSTVRFRSVKAIDVGWRRSYIALFLAAVALALIASYPRLALVVLAYTYTVGALLGWTYARVRKRQETDGPPAAAAAQPEVPSPHEM
jgi:phosphatidylserine synthase